MFGPDLCMFEASFCTVLVESQIYMSKITKATTSERNKNEKNEKREKKKKIVNAFVNQIKLKLIAGF